MSLEQKAQTFEQALMACWEKLRIKAHMLTGNAPDAEDLVQEALTKAYSAWPGFRGEASFATWVQSIMVNAYRDFLKQKSRMRQVSLGDELVEQQASVDLTEEDEFSKRLELLDLRAAMGKALARLPQNYQRLLVLKYIKNMSYQELAVALQCSVESVRCSLYRARQAMRRQLADKNV